MQVAVLGDSIVHGGLDDEFGGWVARLKVQSMREGRGDHVFNLGLGGNTSINILERAGVEMLARKNHVKNIIFSTGTNDMNCQIPLTAFQMNLARLGEIATSLGMKVYFMGLFLRTDRDTIADTAAYDAVIREVCASGGYTYIPTADRISPDDLVDGCHPNAQGHAKLCARVAEFMLD